MKSQPEDFGSTAFGVRDIYRRNTKRLVVGLRVPPETQRQGRLGHYRGSDLWMIKQCERNRAGYAVADDADTLLSMSCSNLLHHSSEPIHDWSAS